MTKPFKLILNVSEVNKPSAIVGPLLTKTEYGVTKKHKVWELKESIWRNSLDYSLKPLFLTIKNRGNILSSDESFEFLDCDSVNIGKETHEDFELVIDYSLYGSPSVAIADPPILEFVVSISYKEHHYETRVSLDTPLSFIQDIIKQSSLSEYRTHSLITITYELLSETSHDGTLKLSEFLHLDVVPNDPIIFLAKIEPSKYIKEVTIRLNPLKLGLLNQKTLYHINESTTLYDLKSLVVRDLKREQNRDFELDEIRLFYQSHLISDLHEGNDISIYEILQLNDEVITEENGVISLTLDVSKNNKSDVKIIAGTGRSSNNEGASNSTNILPGPQDDVAEDRAVHVQPLRIVEQGGNTWELLGESFELMECSIRAPESQGPERLLVNQSDISSMVYEFEIQKPDEVIPVSVSLTTSQCIIVDNENEASYILLSPAGISKLNRVLSGPNGNSLIQQVRLIREPIMNTSSNAPSNASHSNQPERIRADISNNQMRNRRNAFNPLMYTRGFAHYLVDNRTSIALNTAKLIAAIYLLQLDSLVFYFWKSILLYLTIFSALYLIIIRGDSVANQIERVLNLDDEHRNRHGFMQGIAFGFAFGIRQTNLISINIYANITSELINFLVSRQRDSEYIIRTELGQESMLKSLLDSALNFCKDILLLLLAVFPHMRSRIMDARMKWRSAEVHDLAHDIELAHANLIAKLSFSYKHLDTAAVENLVENDTNTSYESLNLNSIFSTNVAISEDEYNSLIDYYVQLKKLLVKNSREIE